ncbi:MAG: flavodoxin domain-containing protein [Acidimicrobiia bacterium]
MRALVIYESMFGNTHLVADAIAEGLADRGADVRVTDPSQVNTNMIDGLDLLVVGGPTHARGMTRPSTRESAIDTAAKDPELEIDPAATGPGVREWLDSMGLLDVAAAAFDTRIDAPPLLTGRAAKGIDGKLRRLGCKRVVEPESFLVTTKNKLVDGELERAKEWGSALVGRFVSIG